jgi:hypothetical protein
MTTRTHTHAPSQPLVNCIACEFAWYGRTAAHGLSVIGHCPRCGGPLQFHGDSSGPERFERVARNVQPWQVLGTPTSWDAA